MSGSRALRKAGIAVLSGIAIAWMPVSSASPLKLQIAWPPNWEYQAPNIDNGIRYVHARHRSGEHVDQQLRLSIVDTAASDKPITRESMKDLVLEFAKGSRSAIHSLGGDVGHYVVIDNKDETRVREGAVEGALLADGYFIHFVLRTEDPKSKATEELLAALARTRVTK